MTTCKTIQPRLTAYLDGELADDRGSVVRGHLRECAACRQVARDEAALRDSLRTLAPIDPPASLWAGVQARLAAAEVADARMPRWRRMVARWMPRLPRFATGGLVAAAVVLLLLYWRAQRADEDVVADRALQPAQQAGAPLLSRVDPAHALARGEAPRGDFPREVSVPAADDVTADLIAEPSRTTAVYGETIEELMKLASEARTGWDDERNTAFDGKVAELRDAIQRAAQGRPQQRAQRVLIRFLQGAVVRDEVLLASGGAR